VLVPRRVDATWARQIADLLDARGKPAASILRDLGLDRTALERPGTRIPFVTHAALFEAAAEHLQDPGFGLHFGSSVDPLDAGALAFLVANSPTLGGAMKNLAAYLKVLTEGTELSLETGDLLAVAAFRIVDPKVERFGQLEEFGLALMMNICRFVVGRRLRPEWVEYLHHPRQGMDALEQYFGAPVRFGQKRTAIVLNKNLLDLPCRNADERLLRILKAHCDDLLEKLGQTADLKQHVAHLVSSHLPSSPVTAKSVASELGMSERTVARRLSEQGLSFGQIVDDVRCRLAERYLREPDMRPSQIAYLLGYSEPSAFTRAFRRWTGRSPSQFRSGVG
jgi:AraC-like DNA-binding protein